MTTQLLLISSSNVHGYGYLDHAEPEIRRILEGRARVAFVPFALQNRQGYTDKVRQRLAPLGVETIEVKSASDFADAEAVFVGGGNTFRLLKTLYDLELMDVIRDFVRAGNPYIGSSAGTNITGPTIKTTNDMPIVFPPTFDAFGFVAYQINPHYLDPDPNSTHKGETREDRIREFLEENDTPVVGIREGTMIRVENGVSTLAGSRPARVFERGKDPYEVEVGSGLNF
jgi:dipeptidase E